MKKKIVTLLIVAAMATPITATENVEFYNDLAKGLNFVQIIPAEEFSCGICVDCDNLIINANADVYIYDTDALDYETLVSRNGDIIVEKIVGICLNDEGNGRILNTETEFNYISYASVADVQKGDVVLTYEIYNPETNLEDDIIERFDYVIDRTESEE